MNNNIEENILKINFFKDKYIDIKKIDLGHSGALTYYINTNNTEYFLKIIENSDLIRVKDVHNSYILNKINVSKLIECGKFNGTSSYYIYESLGRMTLKTKMQSMTLDEIYNVGVYIGKENRKLSNSHKNKLSSNTLAKDFNDRVKNYYLEFIDLLKQNKNRFTNDEYKVLSNQKLKLLLDNLFALIQNEEVIYCHNDIKTNNVMFYNNILYFIDIENTAENFFYRTLAANIFTIFPQTNKKYAEFYNGVLAGFYNFDIPVQTKDYLILNYLSQMLKRINHRITKKNNIEDYIKDTKEFAQLLCESNYFNNFDFSFLKTNKKYELLDIEIKRISSELKKQFNYDFVKKIDGGYSGAISLQLEKNNKKYFCKVCNYIIDLNYLKNVLNVYEQLDINSLKLVDNGTIFNGQYYFVIYNYIDGICLNNYIKENNLTNDEIISFGTKVGSIAQKLKNYKNYNINNFSKLSITDETEKMVNSIKEIINFSFKKEIINKYISINEFNELINNFISYSKSFENQKINLIHQDLKSSNIMICNNEIYIIDIESMALSYNVFDFKCTITWELVQFYEYEINYLKGYFNGLYEHKIPKELLNQLKYIFLYDFFRSLIGLLSEKNINYKKIDSYISGVANIIYKKELENVFNYIVK